MRLLVVEDELKMAELLRQGLTEEGHSVTVATDGRHGLGEAGRSEEAIHLLSGVAGIVLLSRITSGQPKAGQGYEMDVITAVVIGGVSISGGEGNILLVVAGVLIMGVLWGLIIAAATAKGRRSIGGMASGGIVLHRPPPVTIVRAVRSVAQPG